MVLYIQARMQMNSLWISKNIPYSTSLDIAWLAFYTIKFRIISCFRRFETILLAYIFIDIIHDERDKKKFKDLIFTFATIIWFT